ncbi:sperm acrosome-associated protein 7-like [Apodemus sylvaticus]|uniref:sperm acrosome-associated protein 7-like n=1 Tax=Apodemus sylvaticus TaxID=10129 RepID=UPI002244596F|nr:sperm acrosome-associated protein 7-like [Apodemus sylvaticus]
MTVNRGARTFLSVFLLCCWQDVQPWPNRELSGSSDKQWPNLETLDDDIATVFDEILVREILEPGKAPYFENQSPSTTSQQKTTKEKKVHMKESTASKRHQKQSSSGTTHSLSFDDTQKETLFQLRSLEALEKMIDKIRRAIETTLKKKRKFQKSRTRQLLEKLIQP